MWLFSRATGHSSSHAHVLLVIVYGVPGFPIHTFSSAFTLGCAYIIGPKRMVICNLNFTASVIDRNVKFHVLKVHQ